MIDRVADMEDGSVRFALECPAPGCRAGGAFPQLRGTALADILACPACGATWLMEWGRPYESVVNPGRFSQELFLRPTADTRTVGRYLTKAVRHKDGDPQNNAIANLEVVPAPDE